VVESKPIKHRNIKAVFLGTASSNATLFIFQSLNSTPSRRVNSKAVSHDQKDVGIPVVLAEEVTLFSPK